MTESKYEERAENIMPKWSCWGDGLVQIKRVYWYQSRIRIIAILKQLHRAKKRIAELEVVIQCEDCSAKTTISNKCGLSIQVLTGCKAKERIGELESGIKDVCDLINKKTTVSKWKISNQLDRTLKGL